MGPEIDAFNDTLTRLVTREAHASQRDPDRMANLVERLASSLGVAVAIGAHGDPAKIDRLMMGAEKHAHSEAVEAAPLIRAMRRPPSPEDAS